MPRRSGTGRHVLPRPARRLLPFALAGGALLAAVAGGASALSTGGTSASWQKAVPAGSGTMTIGSFGFAFEDAGTATTTPGAGAEGGSTPYSFAALTTAAGHLLPGDIATAEVAVANTGDTPITLAATGVGRTGGGDGAAALHAASTIAVRAAGAECTPQSFAGTALRPFADITPENPLRLIEPGSAVAAGATATLCVAIGLSADADPSVAGQSTTSTITVRADQHRNP